jgi:hypothetical protein
VTGNVKGSSMGGNVRYKNVRRAMARSPHRRARAIPMATEISFGDGSDLDHGRRYLDRHRSGRCQRHDDGRRHRTSRSASKFVRAKTMGGDITIESVDGWVQATTMGGNLDVTVTGSGGDVELTSMSGTRRAPRAPGLRHESRPRDPLVPPEEHAASVPTARINRNRVAGSSVSSTRPNGLGVNRAPRHHPLQYIDSGSPATRGRAAGRTRDSPVEYR